MINTIDPVLNQIKTNLLVRQDKNTSVPAYYKLQHNFRLIRRENDYSKRISAKVEKLIGQLLFRLNMHETLIMSHRQISKITGCQPRQNANLLRQLLMYSMLNTIML